MNERISKALTFEEMRDAALKGERGKFNLEQAVQAMIEYKSKGESVYYVFNGFELNSDEITTVEETIEKYDRFLKGDREPQKKIDTSECGQKDEEIMNEKIDKYFKLLNPKFDRYSTKQKMFALYGKKFIRENIDVIDDFCQGSYNQKEINGHEIIRDAIEKFKAPRIHPIFEMFNSVEIVRLMGVESFIRENIDEIDIYYPGWHNQVNKESISSIIRNEKLDKYFKTLHPEWDKLSIEEQAESVKVKGFICANIEAIDKIYKESMQPESSVQYEGMTKQQILQNAIKSLSEKISVQQIGQATINTSTIAKKEAEQVENGDNTRNNIKEGEEVGDDN